jgi:hypothetical protein
MHKNFTIVSPFCIKKRDNSDISETITLDERHQILDECLKKYNNSSEQFRDLLKIEYYQTLVNQKRIGCIIC